ALVGLRMDPANRAAHAVFGITWLGMVAAAALGNYPTPLVGYGGSAILGYALSLSFMPLHVRSAPPVSEPSQRSRQGDITGNPDFPRRVRYRAAGSDSLVAEIAGMRGGVERTVLFTYAMVACPSEHKHR